MWAGQLTEGVEQVFGAGSVTVGYWIVACYGSFNVGGSANRRNWGMKYLSYFIG
jgi:hypothetical protein